MNKMKKSELKSIIREVLNEQMRGRMTDEQKTQGLLRTLGYPTSAKQFLARYNLVYRELQREPQCKGIPSPERVRKIVMSEKMLNESPVAMKWAIRIIVTTTTTLCGWLWGEVQGWWDSLWSPEEQSGDLATPQLKLEQSGNINNIEGNKLYKILGSPKSPDQLLRGYTKLYNQVSNKPRLNNLPSPEEVATRIDKYAMKGNGRGPARIGPLVVAGIIGLSAVMVGSILYYGGAFDE